MPDATSSPDDVVSTPTRTQQGRPDAVLFACAMNAVRSPMAAAITRQLFPNQIYTRSAGVRPGAADPFVQVVMEEVGIDITRHASKSFEELADSNFDLIITMAPEAHHRALELTRTDAVEVEYWPTMDPSLITGSRSQIVDGYRALRDSLTKRIKERFKWSSSAHL